MRDENILPEEEILDNISLSFPKNKPISLLDIDLRINEHSRNTRGWKHPIFSIAKGFYSKD